MAVDYDVNVDDGIPYLDPTTFAPAVHHPLVYIDSNEFKIHLKKEIQEWLTQMCKDRWSFRLEDKKYYIHFENDADVTLFRLQWL